MAGYIGHERSKNSKMCIDNYIVPKGMISKVLIMEMLNTKASELIDINLDKVQKIPVDMWKELAVYDSWHHTGGDYRKTDHFDLVKTAKEVSELTESAYNELSIKIALRREHNEAVTKAQIAKKNHNKAITQEQVTAKAHFKAVKQMRQINIKAKKMKKTQLSAKVKKALNNEIIRGQQRLSQAKKAHNRAINDVQYTKNVHHAAVIYVQQTARRHNKAVNQELRAKRALNQTLAKELTVKKVKKTNKVKPQKLSSK